MLVLQNEHTNAPTFSKKKKNRHENSYFTDGVKFKVINTNPYSDPEFSAPQNV